MYGSIYYVTSLQCLPKLLSTQTQVGLLATSRVDNCLLTGVRFLVDGSHRIIALAYDCDHLQMWHKLD